jgi:perosamine synthetase
MEIPFGRPIIGPEEKAAVMKVLESPILVHGPLATQFENDFAAFTKAPHAVSVSSCTAGMHLIYFTLGLGTGDEVVVPAMTHVATAHAVELTGARAIFVDAKLDNGNVDISKIEAAITPRTRAIAVVHYLGVPVDMPQVVAIAKKHKLFLVEDCALAPGAWVDGIHAGLHGDAGVFSFYPVKHLTTAEGGMIILKDAALAAKLKLLKAFGVDRTHGERKVPGVYDAVALGFNYRMSEIHAAIGIEQVKKLPGFLATRKANFEALEQGLAGQKGLRVLPQPTGGRLESCHYCLSVLLDEPLAAKRPDIMAALTERKIGSSVYYPQPVPRMTYYRDKYGYDAGLYRNAARIADGTIALPVGPHLGTPHMKHIASNLREIVNGVMK